MSEALEASIRAAAQAGDHGQAVTLAVRGYGEEVYSFLVAHTRSDDRASDAFGQACEDLWRSLTAFQWRCSLRTWFYRLARNAAAREARTPANDPRRRSDLEQLTELAAEVRSRTMAYQRTDVKDRFAALRARLAPEEQMLLVLRVDRGLEWNEIALVLEDDAGDGDDAARRAAGRLRQSFARLKERLRELAIAEGLVEREP